MVNMTLGQNIALARKKKGISQEELSNQLNVSRQSVSLWETNQTVPTIEKLKELSILLDVGVDHLLGLQKEEKEDKSSSLINDARKRDEKTFIIICTISTLLGFLLWQVMVLSIIINLTSLILNIVCVKKFKERFYPIVLLIISIIFLFASIAGTAIL